MSGMSGEYDVIVLGVGGMGAAACCQLARRGQRVLGLEQFDIPHDLGSSGGNSRVIRLAYYEDPAYVPLVRRAYGLWRELEGAAGEQLLVVTGGVDLGAPDSADMRGVQAGLTQHGIPFERLDAAAVRRRFPALQPPDGHIGLYQGDTGFVLPERCTIAHVEQALRSGARIQARERVERWAARDDGVKVVTDRGEYAARRLVITSGPWLPQVCERLGVRLQVERQVQAWFLPLRPEEFEIGRFPVFIHHLDNRTHFYGLPHHGRPGVKVCQHHNGRIVTAENVDRTPTRADEEAVRHYMQQYLPGANGPVVSMKICLYTNTPDHHFIIDRHPHHPEVVIAGGFSGHGFKFAPVIGEMAADLAMNRDSPLLHPIFRLSRFA